MSLYDKKVREYNNILKVLSSTNTASDSRKKEHQKEMSEYRDNTQMPTSAMQSGRDAEGRTLATDDGDIYTSSLQNNSYNVIPSYARNPVGMTKRDYGYTRNSDMLYKPQKPKSAFEQWNIEKTQPKLSYGQEKLIRSYNSAGSPWLDASMRKYATRQMQASEVDKQWAGGYNKSEYKSPAYARQMSYRGLKRDTYNPQEQKAIIKDGLDSAGMKYNGRTYMQQIDAYDREEEALDYLTNNIVYGSNIDDDLIGSWVTRQDAGEKWLADVFGEKKKNELSKRLQKKLNSVTLEEKQKNASKYKDYTSNDFALPDAAEYKKEHNIGVEDEELKTWETVLDILQAGLDAAGVIPGVGVAPDLVNAAIYAIRGDWLNAGLSAAAAIPIVGDAGTVGKYGIKAAKAIDKIADGAKYADDVIDVGKDMLKYGDEVVEGIVKNGDEVAEVIAKNADNVAGVGKTAGAGGKIPWDSWHNYEKVTDNGQEYAKVGDRLYSKHAVDRMQPSGNRFGVNVYQGLDAKDYGRSIAPEYIEYVINNSQGVFQQKTKNYSHVLGNIEVIVNNYGAVVTVITYKQI